MEKRRRRWRIAVFLTQSEYRKELGAGGASFVLFVVEENEDNHEQPLIMKYLLEEFHDVIPEEIPHGLPPMRDIQHCIDLIPGAVLPNKAAYRMNPKEYEELQRQVDDFWKKAYFKKVRVH